MIIIPYNKAIILAKKLGIPEPEEKYYSQNGQEWLALILIKMVDAILSMDGEEDESFIDLSIKIEGKPLTEECVNDSVTYIPPHANGDVNSEVCERGIITSWNEIFVFVNYGNGSTSKATDPKMLVWG